MTVREERFYYDEPDAPVPNVPVHPGAAAILFDNLDRILIIKRTCGPYWCIPGGRMDVGESSQDCCVRETEEETGLKTQVIRLIGLYSNPRSICSYPDGNVHQSFLALFECEVIGGELRESAETTRFHWMSKDKLDDFVLLPDSRICCLDAWVRQEEAFIR